MAAALVLCEELSPDMETAAGFVDTKRDTTYFSHLHLSFLFFFSALLYLYSLADLCFSVWGDKVGGRSCFYGPFVAH